MTMERFLFPGTGALVHVLAGEDGVAEHGAVGHGGDDVAGLGHVPGDGLSLDLWHEVGGRHGEWRLGLVQLEVGLNLA